MSPLPEPPRHCPRCGRAVAEGAEGYLCLADGYRWYADPKVAVGVLVADERGRLLLVRRNHDPARGRWAFPSGFVDAGEVLEDAAVREVFEETGVRVRLDRLLGAWSASGDAVVFLAYAGTWLDGEAQPGPEASELAWFEVDALPPLAFDHDPEIVEAWRSGEGVPTRSRADADGTAAPHAPEPHTPERQRTERTGP